MDKQNNLLLKDVMSFRMETPLGLKKELEPIKKRIKQIALLLKKAKSKGIDILYPNVTATVLRNFVVFCEEDFAADEFEGVKEQIRQLKRISKRCLLECREIVSGKEKPFSAPSYITSPIKIVGPSFIGKAKMDGKIVSRPIFFVGHGMYADVRRDIEKFPSYGVNIIQLDFYPSQIFSGEKPNQTRVKTLFLDILDRAAEANVRVDLNLWWGGYPKWMLKKYPQIKPGSSRYDLPESRDFIERFLRYTLSQMKSHPALHSIQLANEIAFAHESESKTAQALWHKWLRTRYGKIDKLNQHWGVNFAGFEEIWEKNVINIPSGKWPEPSAHLYDWCLFNQQHVTESIRWLDRVVHSIAPEVPTHVKIRLLSAGFPPNYWYRRIVADSVDPQSLGNITSIHGNDFTKMSRLRRYKSGYAPLGWANSWIGENMAYDLQRSAADKPIFNSENHLIADGDFSYVRPEHIRNTIWQGAIHGQSATALWVWSRGYYCRKTPKTKPFYLFTGKLGEKYGRGYWASHAANIMMRPECVEALGKTSLDLNRLANEVTKIQKLKPQIALVFSLASRVYNAETYYRTLYKTYEALNFTGVKLGLITERQLANIGKKGWGIMKGKQLEELKVIVLPNVTHIPEDAFQGIREFAKTTGNIVLIGNDCLKFDAYGKKRRENKIKNSIRWDEGDDSRTLWVKFNKLIGQWRLYLPVKIVDKAGAPIWGIEYLTVEDQGDILINLCNYLKDSRELYIMKDKKPLGFTNLLDGKFSKKINLGSLESALLYKE